MIDFNTVVDKPLCRQQNVYVQRYPDHLVKQARRLVSSGKYGYVEIANILGVNKNVVSVWCKDLMGSKYQGLIKHNEKIRQGFIESEKHKVFDLSKSPELYCAILYGCEGSKYPASTGVSLTNSDPRLIKGFVVLLRKSFVLDETKWRIHLQVHDNQDFGELVSFWSDLLSVPKEQFYNPTVTTPKGRKHRNKYYGTCSVRYGDYRIQLKLIGIFDEFLRKSVILEDGQNGYAAAC